MAKKRKNKRMRKRRWFTANPARRFPENHIMPDRSLTWSRIGPKTMPAQPTWFQLLSEILDVLRGMEASHLDRQGGPAILRRRPPPRPAMDGRFDRHPGRQRRPSSQRSETDLSPIEPVTSGLLVSLLPLIHRVDRPLTVWSLGLKRLRMEPTKTQRGAPHPVGNGYSV